jgi:hypothetical protein
MSLARGKNGAERAALPRVLLDSSASPYLVLDDDDADDALGHAQSGCTAA